MRVVVLPSATWAALDKVMLLCLECIPHGLSPILGCPMRPEAEASGYLNCSAGL